METTRQIRGGAGADSDRGQPNIILILNDDMGFSDLGCYGGEIATPNLDRLAAGGLRFSQFYNTARCCPSRASLLTGLYPHQADIGHMMDDDGVDGYTGDLNSDTLTIAEALGEAGYRAYMSGKWHLTRHVDGPKHNWPCQRGFDSFFGIITGACSYYHPSTLTRNNERTDSPQASSSSPTPSATRPQISSGGTPRPILTPPSSSMSPTPRPTGRSTPTPKTSNATGAGSTGAGIHSAQNASSGSSRWG